MSTLDVARQNRLVAMFDETTVTEPTFTGLRVFDDYDVAELVPYIDWTPFFRTWGIRSKFPEVLTDPEFAEAARPLYDDALAMLDKIVADKWFRPRAVVGFWPAHADVDDIVVYTDETRTAERTRFHGTPPAGDQDRWPAEPQPVRLRRSGRLRRRRLGRRIRRHGGPGGAGDRRPLRGRRRRLLVDPAEGARRPRRRGVRGADPRAGAHRVVGVRPGRVVHAQRAPARVVPGHPPGAGVSEPARPHREGGHCSTCSTRPTRRASS